MYFLWKALAITSWYGDIIFVNNISML